MPNANVPSYCDASKERVDKTSPIRPEDLDDLIPDLKTQEELNDFEQKNIAQAEQWAPKSRKLKKGFPTNDTLKLLHEKMFDKTWKWAGDFRLKELTIGIEWSHIPTEVKKLCDDVHYWIANNTYPWDEMAAMLGLQLSYCFRCMARPFTWGSKRIDKKGQTRDEYIKALKDTDKGSIDPLVR